MADGCDVGATVSDGYGEFVDIRNVWMGKYIQKSEQWMRHVGVGREAPWAVKEGYEPRLVFNKPEYVLTARMFYVLCRLGLCQTYVTHRAVYARHKYILARK